MTHAPDAHTPLTLVAREPEDLLATVPVVLGFHPRDSLVLLTVGPGAGFHARVDLPTTEADLPEILALLEQPVRRERVTRAVLVAYAADAHPAEAVLHGAATALRRLGVEVLAAFRADGRRWFSSSLGADPAGVPYDISGHPFLADAVLRGQVTHASREELGALLASHEDSVAAVEAAIAARVRLGGRAQRAAEAAWVRARVAAAVGSGDRLSDADAARLVLALADRQVRDELLVGLCRATAAVHAELLLDLVRRTPPGLVAAPATLLGFAWWLCGHGALAWCAVDRAEEDEPGYTLAGYLGVALQHGLSPALWEDFRRGTLRGPAPA